MSVQTPGPGQVWIDRWGDRVLLGYYDNGEWTCTFSEGGGTVACHIEEIDLITYVKTIDLSDDYFGGDDAN